MNHWPNNSVKVPFCLNIYCFMILFLLIHTNLVIQTVKGILTNNTNLFFDGNKFKFPNPTFDILNIANSYQIYTYQIFQMDEKLITQGNNFTEDISKFINGVYF
jgi:hypothetical protein